MHGIEPDHVKADSPYLFLGIEGGNISTQKHMFIIIGNISTFVVNLVLGGHDIKWIDQEEKNTYLAAVAKKWYAMDRCHMDFIWKYKIHKQGLVIIQLCYVWF